MFPKSKQTSTPKNSARVGTIAHVCRSKKVLKQAGVVHDIKSQWSIKTVGLPLLYCFFF